MKTLDAFRMLALGLSFAAFAASPAEARLGETEAQCQARYGAPAPDLLAPTDKPLLPGAEKETVFNFDGWRVRVAFLNGKAVRMEYAKLPEAGALKKLSEAEVQAILEAQKGSFRWREEKPRTGNSGLDKLKTAFEGRKWERSDHAAAKLMFDLVLVMETREVEAFEKKQSRQAAKATPAPGQPIPRF
jgi:hypothetical protein